ncbi:MAG: PRC-barrel domain-containing protein, partial [Longimicrobiales bacterium]|nr:PRC-barrel domain-containing protein [Longimicrobiales bacterium]
AVRYLVADTGSWLDKRQVLIAPHALTAVDRDRHHIVVNLTKEQIEGSPSLDTDKPVSRQFEMAYFGYYDWPMYWSGPQMWGYYPHIVHDRAFRENATPDDGAWDPNLRSAGDVTGYHIQDAEGEIGHVDDFIIEDKTWAIRYLVIETGSWWSGKKVLISPKWIERISWSESRVFVSLSRETIKQSPEYTEESLVTRDYEAQLHRHYDREGYWVEEPVAAKKSG